MTPPRARVIPRELAGGAVLLPPSTAPRQAAPARARVLPQKIVWAQAEAARIIARAEAEAQQIVGLAEARAQDLGLQQQARARADALCLVVTEALELRRRQSELEASLLDRSIGFAKLLAERLLEAELEQRPERVRELARKALEEATGARHARIAAHPTDAAELRAGLEGLGPLLDSLQIEADDSVARGQLRVETEIGVIEADVRGQLARLAAQLKRLIESHATDAG